jgi:hypothetical protein
MKRTKVRVALSVGAVVGALAAACGSSNGSSAGFSPPTASGGFGGTSGGGPATGRPAVPVACGPTMTCPAPLNFCCILGKESGADGGEADGMAAASDSGDASSASDTANDAEAGGRGAGSMNDAGAGSDAASIHDAGDERDAARADDAEVGADANTGSAGATYSCTSHAGACPTGSTVLGCASYQNCGPDEACCGDLADGGLLASCGRAPCLGGLVLCTQGSDCAAGQVCIPAIAGAVTYGTCAISDAKRSDAGDSGG